MSLRPPWADRRALNASLRTTCSCALLEGTRLVFGPSPSRLLRSLQPGPEELSCRTRWSTKTIQRRSPRTLHVTAPPDPTRPAPNTATESPPPRRPLVRLSPGKSVDVCGMHQLDHSIFVPTSTPHLTTTVRINGASVSRSERRRLHEPPVRWCWRALWMRDGDQVSRALREGLAAARHRPACGFLASVSPTAVETSPGDEHRHGAGRRGGGRCIEHRDPAVLRGEVGCLQQHREAGNESFIPGATSSPGQARCRRAPPPDRRVARHARRRAGCRASRSRSSATACVAAASRAPTSPGRKRPTPRSSAGATCALRAARSSSSFRAGSAGGCGTRSRRSRTRWRCGATRARAPSRARGRASPEQWSSLRRWVWCASAIYGAAVPRVLGALRERAAALSAWLASHAPVPTSQVPRDAFSAGRFVHARGAMPMRARASPT